MTIMVDYNWNCRKSDCGDYYETRKITARNFTETKFLVNFTDPKNPLIRVSDSGYVLYAKTNDQKIALILDSHKSAQIHFVWMGTYSSDVFALPQGSDFKRIALNALGYKTDQEKLEDLNIRVEKLEREYQHNYRSTQRWQAMTRDLEEALINAKTERDMLDAHLNPKHPDQVAFNKAHGYPVSEDQGLDQGLEYNYEPDSYTDSPSYYDKW